MRGATISSVYGKAPHRRPISDTPLDAWLRARQISRTAFARSLGVTHRTVHLWCNNQALPDLVNAFRISQLTEGGVAPSMWMGTELAKFLMVHDKADWEGTREKRRSQNRRAYIQRKRRDGEETT